MPYNLMPPLPIPQAASGGAQAPASPALPEIPNFSQFYTPTFAPAAAAPVSRGMYGQMGGMGLPPSGALPFTGQFARGMGQLEQLINQTRGAGVAPQDLDTARNRSRQAAAARGLDGPLAATIEADAQGRVLGEFDKIRADRLMNLIGMQSQLAMAAQQAEMYRRMQMAQYQAAQAQAHAQRGAGIWGTLGTLAGAGIGTLVSPGAGTMIGAQLGNGLGNLGYGFFG